MNLVP